MTGSQATNRTNSGPEPLRVRVEAPDVRPFSFRLPGRTSAAIRRYAETHGLTVEAAANLLLRQVLVAQKVAP